MTDPRTQPQLQKLRRQAEQLLSRLINKSAPHLQPENVTALVHELQVHQTELEMQCHELRRTQSELEDSRDSYRELYESIPVGYVTLDRVGSIYDMNPVAEALLRRDTSPLPIRNFFAFFSDRDLDRFTLFCRGIVSKQTPDTGEFEMRRADTAPFFAALQAVPVKTGKGKGERLRITFRDITSRKETENAMRRYQDELEANRLELQSLASQLISIQEKERQRIACELHDDYCQRITAVLLEVSSLSKRCRDAAPSLMPQISAMRETLTNILREFRQLSHELHPQNLTTLSLATNLRSLIREVSSHSGLQIEFQEESVPEPMPQPTAVCLYRLAQESLSNIQKHAKATSAVVKLIGAPEEMRLWISDNGVGFEKSHTPQTGKGIGLTSMQERVRTLGGNLSIESGPEKGTTIIAVIPLSQTA